MNMKRFIRFVRFSLLIAVIGLVTACGGSSASAAPIENPTAEQLLGMDWVQIEEYAKKEGKVSYWLWHDEEAFLRLCDAFTAKYGIPVELTISDKVAGETKILAEMDGKTGSFDVFKCGGEFTKTAIEGGLYAGPILQIIEGRELLDEGLSIRQEGVEHNGYLVPMYLNQTGLAYNPNHVTDLPQTWEEFEAWIDANPKRFGFCVPENGGSGQALAHTVIACLTGGYDQYYGDGDCDPEKLAKWDVVWDWFNERKNKLTFTTSNADSISRLNQGEFYMIAAWDSDIYRATGNGDLFKDARMYIPSIGMAGGGDTNGLLKNAAHPAAGLLLINFLSSPEAQAIYVEETKGLPARQDVPTPYSMLSPGDMQYRIAWTPACYKAEYKSGFTEKVLMNR